MSATLKRTPFYAKHVAAGARLIDFGGWEMPVQYSGIIAEHRRVRESVGLFDVSHMGEIRVKGPGAVEVVRYLVANDVQIADGQAQYSPLCNEQGGIVDDLIVYKVSDDEIFICVNASNREKDHAWMVAHNPRPGEVEIIDEGDQWAQVAIQGRHAPALLQGLTGVDLSAIRYYWFAQGDVAGVEGCIIARTGYTGEDGFEVFLPPGATELWDRLMEAGAPYGILPIGLGARDTLRLEARMNLYGHEMDDVTTPLEAGIGWAVKLDRADFVGRDAMLAQRAAGVPRRLVSMTVAERIPRQGCAIQHQGEVVGVVTSGTRSPSLEANIALGYVPAGLSKPGTTLDVDVRGKLAPATIIKPPFYKRPY